VAELSKSFPIGGKVAPGFEPVLQEFRENFARRGEIGAACAAWVNGHSVVDLWGGFRDARRHLPWEEDTLALVFSTTKGLAAMAIAVACSRGLFELETPVSRYWPEFAAADKRDITVRQLLTHQAGVCALDAKVDAEILSSPDRLAGILAGQRPFWRPGMYHGYHPVTLGWYESELIRRTDPQHRTLGRYFAEEVAGPLGLEFYIGLPRSVSTERIAVLRDYYLWQVAFHLRDLPPAFALAILNPFSLVQRAMRNPPVWRPSELSGPLYRTLEIPAANGIGLPRSIAKAYGEFAAGAPGLAISDRAFDAIVTAAPPPPGGILDRVFKVRSSFAAGYFKPSPDFRFGSSNRAFGMPGLGGSFGFADPDLGLGYAYVPNRLGYHLWNDPREMALREAVYRCLLKSRT
jgi:CubicO group peptidase (beta-lactamase class C family)